MSIFSWQQLYSPCTVSKCVKVQVRCETRGVLIFRLVEDTHRHVYLYFKVDFILQVTIQYIYDKNIIIALLHINILYMLRAQTLLNGGAAGAAWFFNGRELRKVFKHSVLGVEPAGYSCSIESMLQPSRWVCTFVFVNPHFSFNWKVLYMIKA